MKPMIASTATCLLLILSSLTLASPYIEAGAAYVIADNDIDNSVSPIVKLGYELEQLNGAVELEVQSNTFERDETGYNLDAEKTSVLINYKHRVFSRNTMDVSLVAGAGISATEYNVSDNESDEDGLFTFKLGASTDIALKGNWVAHGSISLQSYDEFDDEDTSAPDSLGTHLSVGTGIGYRFR